jgi:uncharacterized protein (TIGR00730 family)
MNKTIVVFGAFDIDKNNSEYEKVVELGKKLALNNYNVMTGGYQGMMEAASFGAYQAKKEKPDIKIIGATVEGFKSRKKPNQYLNLEVRCKDLYERLRKFDELGDAFIVTWGSVGTLNELFLFWVLKYQNFLNNKPIILFGKFWNEFLENTQKLGVREEHIKLLSVFNSSEDIINYLNDFF